MLDIILLGTGGTQPLPERALAAACITVGGSNLLLESIEAYQPVISLAIEPRNADEGKALDEALDLVGAEPLEAENSCDPDYILNGVELWYDDLDLVPDNYGEESEDE